jgi:ABC-type transport system involved in multi-copper enzyme maturation permease subunit
MQFDPRKSAMRWGPGPVFVYECVTNARRWQTYAARSLGVAVLLLILVTIAWSNEAILTGISAIEYARLGAYYFYTLIGVQLSFVMLAAPAATAWAIWLARARGTLTHMLATDLSDAEIVLGKLAGRLLPVLGLVACTWPMMAISSLLGGIDPVILTMAFAVIVAVAVLGCSSALALSVWARKSHDVVVVVYALWALIALAYPIMWLLAATRVVGGPPRWLRLANPFYLAFASYLAPGSIEPADFLWFLTVTLAASAALVLTAVWRMRPVASRGTDEGRKPGPVSWLSPLWLRPVDRHDSRARCLDHECRPGGRHMDRAAKPRHCDVRVCVRVRERDVADYRDRGGTLAARPGLGRS